MGAVIWCVIVIVWGAVLIPMWLRRHDDTGDGAADRFVRSVRVLSRRSGAAARGHTRDLWLRTTRQPARKRAALPVRRARRLLALLGVAFLTAVAASLSIPAALPLCILAGAAVVGYVVHLRLAVRDAARRQAKQQRRQRAKAAVTTWDALLGEGTMPGISPEVPAASGVPVARGESVARPAAVAGRRRAQPGNESVLVGAGADADVVGGTDLTGKRAVGQ